MSSNIRGFPSERHDHTTFEERRGTRIEALKKELVRDNLLDPRKLDNIQYYDSIDEQNQFLDRITNGQTFGRSEFGYWEELEPLMYFGQTMKQKQDRFTKEFGIPLILPKFSDLTNISVKEQLFLAMQGVGIGKDIQGRYGMGGGGGSKANFQKIIDSGGKLGAYYQNVEPSEYYISIGAVPIKFLREIEVHGAVSGTGFQRGRGYVGEEPEITTSQVEPLEITPSSTQKKPESVFQPPEPEPEVITAHIEPPVEAEPEKLYEVYGQILPLSQSAVDYYEDLGIAVTTSQVEPPGVEEPQVTTSQVEPPGVEEPAVTTSQVEPPGQEVTAEISWFGSTWFPWHLELEDRRRR